MISQAENRATNTHKSESFFVTKAADRERRSEQAELDLLELRVRYETRIHEYSKRNEELEMHVAQLKKEIDTIKNAALNESTFSIIGMSSQIDEEIIMMVPKPAQHPSQISAPQPKPLPNAEQRLSEILEEHKKLGATLSKALSKINALSVEAKSSSDAKESLLLQIQSHRQMFIEYERRLELAKMGAQEASTTVEEKVSASAKEVAILQSELQEKSKLLEQRNRQLDAKSKQVQEMAKVPVPQPPQLRRFDEVGLNPAERQRLLADQSWSSLELRLVRSDISTLQQWESERQDHLTELTTLKQENGTLKKEQQDLKEENRRIQQEVKLRQEVINKESEEIAIQKLQLEALKEKMTLSNHPEESAQLQFQTIRMEHEKKELKEQHQKEIQLLEGRIADMEKEKRVNAELFEEKVRQLEKDKSAEIAAYQVKLEEATKPRQIAYYIENLLESYKGKYGAATDLSRLREQLLRTIDDLIKKHNELMRSNSRISSSNLRQ